MKEEAKPDGPFTDESRALTDIEAIIAEVDHSTPERQKNVLGDKWKYINAIADYIAKTALIKDKACQARVEKIFEEIENFSTVEQSNYRDGGIPIRAIPESSYQALISNNILEVRLASPL